MLSSFMATIVQAVMAVTSPAFQDGKMIPEEFTCEGRNVNPPLIVTGLPEKTVSMVLIMDDPDAPGGTFDHWIVYNIPAGTVIGTDTIPGVQGVNGRGAAQYTGPCPPSGVHHYHFKVYALDSNLDLAPGASKDEVRRAMENHILGSGELVGVYTKDNENPNKR